MVVVVVRWIPGDRPHAVLSCAVKKNVNEQLGGANYTNILFDCVIVIAWLGCAMAVVVRSLVHADN